MTLAVHLFLIALDRVQPQNRVPHLRRGIIAAKVGIRDSDPLSSEQPVPSALLPCLAFAAVMALNVLTKGLIGLVFPIAFVLLYLAITKQLHLLLKLHLLASTAVFLAIAAPWHILAALRNPAIALPPGLGLPATGGWAWFYLYNEHIARFLSKRIPHDYGLTPVWLFWLFLVLWIMPWAIFLPTALAENIRTLRSHAIATAREHEAALSLILWALLVLGFFTLSNRQEYYSLPALPALALMIGSILALAECTSSGIAHPATNRSALNWHLYTLVPLTTLVAIVCGYFALTAPRPAPGTDIVALLTMAGSTEAYNLSLSHVSDLTGSRHGLLPWPPRRHSTRHAGHRPHQLPYPSQRPHLRRQPHPRRRDDSHTPRRTRRPCPLLPHPRLKGPRARHQRSPTQSAPPRRPHHHRRRTHRRLDT